MRQSLIVAASIIVGSLLLGLLLGGSSTGQVPVVPGLAPGRYKASMVQMTASRAKILVIDTATGQCWTYNSGEGSVKWNDLGSPAAVEQAR